MRLLLVLRTLGLGVDGVQLDGHHAGAAHEDLRASLARDRVTPQRDLVGLRAVCAAEAQRGRDRVGGSRRRGARREKDGEKNGETGRGCHVSAEGSHAEDSPSRQSRLRCRGIQVWRSQRVLRTFSMRSTGK